MRHFAHNIGDYAAATAHLSFVEDAAYHRLLRRYYQDERPLPAALTDCQRLVGARTKEEREAVRVVLEEFFTLQADGWHQSRADREITAYQERADAARRNGTKGGRPKPKNNPAGYPTGSEEKPNRGQSGKLTTPHSPLPMNQEPDLCVSPTSTGPASAPAGATQPQAGRAVLIWDDWQPSDAALSKLRKLRPELVGKLYDDRMLDFREWCRSKAVTSHDPEATWSSFMRKTKLPAEQQPPEDWNTRRIREAKEAVRRAEAEEAVRQ